MLPSVIILVLAIAIPAILRMIASRSNTPGDDHGSGKGSTTIRCPHCGSPARRRGDSWECPWCGDSGRIIKR